MHKTYNKCLMKIIGTSFFNKILFFNNFYFQHWFLNRFGLNYHYRLDQIFYLYTFIAFNHKSLIITIILFAFYYRDLSVAASLGTCKYTHNCNFESINNFSYKYIKSKKLHIPYKYFELNICIRFVALTALNTIR